MAGREGYAVAQIATHWLVVLLVIVQLVFAENMSLMVHAMDEGRPVSSQVALGGIAHYWAGLVILSLMVLRLGMRIVLGAPLHAPGATPVVNVLAGAIHGALYGVLLAGPITGLLAYYRVLEVGDIHALIRPVLIGLVALHVLGVVYNQLIRKDGTPMRMRRPAR